MRDKGLSESSRNIGGDATLFGEKYTILSKPISEQTRNQYPLRVCDGCTSTSPRRVEPEQETRKLGRRPGRFKRSRYVSSIFLGVIQVCDVEQRHLRISCTSLNMFTKIRMSGELELLSRGIPLIHRGCFHFYTDINTSYLRQRSAHKRRRRAHSIFRPNPMNALRCGIYPCGFSRVKRDES